MSVELRKAKKDDQLSKRRNLNTVDEQQDLSSDNSNLLHTFVSLEELLNAINSADEELLLSAIKTCRKSLSREKNPPISAMIENGIVQRCVDLLDYDQK